MQCFSDAYKRQGIRQPQSGGKEYELHPKSFIGAIEHEAETAKFQLVENE